MSKPIKPSALPFAESHRRTLSILADVIIPASDEFSVPGAGDATICQSIISDAGGKLPRLVRAMRELDETAQSGYGMNFAELPNEQLEPCAEAFREAHPSSANLVEGLTTQCYYRDDRVMLSLGMEPRPPHPAGYEIEQGDWGLLDPVRNRDSFFRKTE